jgi:hypothetical protein
MIPPIAKFTIGLNTGLAIFVAIDVFRGMKIYKYNNNGVVSKVQISKN